MEVSSKQSLVEKYIEFKQLMLRIDPAEEDEEEKLASTMRAYQVMESPHIMNPSGVVNDGNPAPPVIPPLQLYGTGAPGMMSFTPMSTPMKASGPGRPKGSRTPRSPRADKSSSGKKSKSHKKRKRKMDSDDSDDDSDCDPDFRA